MSLPDPPRNPVRPPNMGFIPDALRPPDARGLDSFMMKPRELQIDENKLARKLTQIQVYVVRRWLTDKDEAIALGHQALEKHYRDILENVNIESMEKGLEPVSPSEHSIRELLDEAKKDWINIVTDLYALPR